MADDATTRTLVLGWFAVDGGEATAGDLLARDQVVDLARQLGDVDVATNLGLGGGIDWRSADPAAYDRVVFVCGPLHGEAVEAMLDRFADVRTVAVDVSVVDDDVAARFDVVVPRDRGDRAEPDLTFAAAPPRLPVVGVVRAHAQPEYDDARHRQVHDVVRLALASRACATVDFDTRVHPAADPLDAHARGAAEVAALAARMDAVVTTRLHGLVLSLAQGTPVVAIDPVLGGAKVARQAAAVGWPCAMGAEDAHVERVSRALSWCLTPAAREEARRCAERARDRLRPVQARIRAALEGSAAEAEPG